MTDRGSKTGSLLEEAPIAETEVPLHISEDEPKVDPFTQPGPIPETGYQNIPSSREPKNVRINLYDRDPTNMNEIVKLEFDEVFAEPLGSHSIDGVWTASHTVFTGTKHWCYRILSAIFAVPCAFCCGIYFACLACNNIWNVQPTTEISTGPCWDERIEQIYQNESQNKEPNSVRISLYDRDPRNINDLVKVQFEDLFAEPEGAHSLDPVWRTSYQVFTGTKHWCYRILSAIFAVPCAFCWGLHYACLTFQHIWTIQPSLKSCHINIFPLAKLWGLFVRSFCDPFCESVGLMLSKIKVTKLNHN